MAHSRRCCILSACRVPNPDTPRADAAQPGTAGRSGSGRGRGGAIRQGHDLSFSNPRSLKTTVVEESSEARIKKISCKPNGGIRRAVEKRFIPLTTAALRSQLLPNGPFSFVFVNLFHARHIREKNMIGISGRSDYVSRRGSRRRGCQVKVTKAPDWTMKVIVTESWSDCGVFIAVDFNE